LSLNINNEKAQIDYDFILLEIKFSNKHKFQINMISIKSTLTCSYCIKIFKDPIELPCKHHLCKEHLFEKNVVKLNRKNCIECKQEFTIKDNDFRTDSCLKKQLDDHVYLNNRQFSFKNKIEDSIRTFFLMFEEFTLNKISLDLDVHEHFQEIRRNIDLHREVIKEKIDDIYMEMIEKTKNFEATYVKSLADKLEASLK
jgi:hypothetical protein